LTHGLADVHGGFIATLIDNAGWFSAAIHYDRWINTVEYHVRLLEPAKREGLTAKGQVVRVGKRITVVGMEVYSDSGRLVAMGSGTFAVTNVPL